MFFNSNKKNETSVDGFSHLGEGASFQGEIHCKGEIEVAGNVKGKLSHKNLAVDEGAQLEITAQTRKRISNLNKE